MEIIRDRKAKRFCLSQKSYIEKVLERFGVHNAKAVSTPFLTNLKLYAKMSPQIEEAEEFMSRVPYSNAVGSLMYHMVCTRPDIAHAMSVFSHYMANPRKPHWQAVK